MRTKLACLTVSLLFLCSCASFMEDVRQAPPQRTAVEQKSLSIVVPSSADLTENNATTGPLWYAWEEIPGGSNFSWKTESGYESDGSFYLQSAELHAGEARWTSYSRVIFDVKKERSGGTDTITFTTKAIELKKGGTTRIPKFTAQDALSLLKNPRVQLKFETDAPYDADSVFSNFTRKFDANLRKTGDRTGNIRASSGEDRYLCTVKVWPYKGGSKATFEINYEVRAGREPGDRLDLTERLKAVKDSLIAVVNG